jgi:hypothetical protein
MHFSIFNGFGSLDKLGMTVKQAPDDSETGSGEVTPLPEQGYVDMDHNQPARSLRT